jgi:hypothetical protein
MLYTCKQIFVGENMVNNGDTRDGSCQGRKASDWSDPHQGPPHFNGEQTEKGHSYIEEGFRWKAFNQGQMRHEMTTPPT